ncbi:MAG TPA: hypothetical protein VGS79_17205 [Puia sp.]|nr:hypothetical protein [Puia sp.]
MKTINDLLRKFKSVESEIRNISGKTFTIEEDENGMLDKECPHIECHAKFKVNEEDWRNSEKAEIAFCPQCGKNSHKSEFLPASVKEMVAEEIGKRISANWANDQVIPQNIVTLQTSAASTNISICPGCDSRFAINDTAMFCPCCGSNIEN